jgi:hypothetical protein
VRGKIVFCSSVDWNEVSGIVDVKWSRCASRDDNVARRSVRRGLGIWYVRSWVDVRYVAQESSGKIRLGLMLRADSAYRWELL